MQAGPYDSKILNHHMTDEPFPVTVTVRSEKHAKLITDEAEKYGVLEAAKQEH